MLFLESLEVGDHLQVSKCHLVVIPDKLRPVTLAYVIYVAHTQWLVIALDDPLDQHQLKHIQGNVDGAIKDRSLQVFVGLVGQLKIVERFPEILLGFTDLTLYLVAPAILNIPLHGNGQQFDHSCLLSAIFYYFVVR